MKTYLKFIGRLETSEVNEINRSRTRHEVDANGQDKDTEESDDGCEIIIPKLLPNLFSAQTPNFGAKHKHKNRYGRQINRMVYEVVITKFHVLQVHGLKKIR